MKMQKADRPQRDGVDRAVARIRKATGELVRLMGNPGPSQRSIYGQCGP